MTNPWEATELFGKMLGEYTDNGYRQGVYEERERIIALLDSLKCNCDGECGMVEAPFTVLERLIKEENE